jgi:hypothetical protein
MEQRGDSTMLWIAILALAAYVWYTNNKILVLVQQPPGQGNGSGTVSTATPAVPVPAPLPSTAQTVMAPTEIPLTVTTMSGGLYTEPGHLGNIMR